MAIVQVTVRSPSQCMQHAVAVKYFLGTVKFRRTMAMRRLRQIGNNGPEEDKMEWKCRNSLMHMERQWSVVDNPSRPKP